MMKLFNSISKKIMLGYTGILLILMTSSGLLFDKTNLIAYKNDVFVSTTLPALRAIELADAQLSAAQIAAFALYGTTIDLAEFNSQLDQFNSQVSDAIYQLSRLNKNVGLALKKQHRDIKQSVNLLGIIMTGDSVDWDAAREQLAIIQSFTNTMHSELKQFKHTISEQANAATTEISSQITAMTVLLFISVSSITLIIIIAFFIAQLTLIKPVESLSKQLDTIAVEHDLTTTVIVDTHDEVQVTATSINKLLNAFRQGSIDISNSAAGLLDSAGQLSKAATTSDEQVLECSHQIEALLAKIQALEISTQQSADSSSAASATALVGAKQVSSGVSNVADSAKSIAELSRDIDTAAEMLLNLKNAGDKVGSVVNTIADIAEQTNLLALNAAIEAARAGESGRGFAVVADEVRTLASRTHESTHEINTILDTIVGSISSTVSSMDSNKANAIAAVSLAESTVVSLTAIQQTVSSISSESQALANQAKHNSKDATDMRNNVEQIRSASELLRDSSHDTRAESNSMAGLASSLNQIINRFKL